MSRQLLGSLLVAALIVAVTIGVVALRLGPQGLETPDAREERLEERQERREEQREDRGDR